MSIIRNPNFSEALIAKGIEELQKGDRHQEDLEPVPVLQLTLPVALAQVAASSLDKRHHFRATGMIGFEKSPHGAGDCQAARFADATNGHTRMSRFEDDDDPFRVEFLLNQVGNLMGHPLLYLRSMRHFFDNASQFGKPDDLATRQITDVSRSDKWQQMVFAHTVERDIPDKDQFVVLLCEDAFQVPSGIEVQAHKEFGVHPGDTGRCFEQSLAIRIFTDGGQDLANGAFHARQIDRGKFFVNRRRGSACPGRTVNAIVVIFSRSVSIQGMIRIQKQ